MVEKTGDKRAIIREGHVPVEKGWIPSVRGGYQPETSEAGNPPTGGGGGKEPEQKS